MIKLSDGNQYDQLGQAEQLLRETAAMSIYYMPNRINTFFFLFLVTAYGWIWNHLDLVIFLGSLLSAPPPGV